MKNLFDFVDAVLDEGIAVYNIVTGEGITSGFCVSESGHTDLIGLFGNETTRMILVHSFVREFISKNGLILSDANYSLEGRCNKSMFVLDVVKVYDSRRVAEKIAVENNQASYLDIFNNEFVDV